MRYQVKEVQDKSVWDSFLLRKNPQSFLQSWNWGETNRLVGHKIYRLGFYNSGELVGVCLAIKEKAKRGPHFVVPGGPIIDWKNKNLVDAFVSYIKDLGRKEKVWFVRIRPEVHESVEARKLFSSLGMFPAPMHLHAENTWVLDITSSEEEILRQMRKTTRYLVKKSLGMGLIVEESINPGDSTILSKLQEETVKRHKFVGFSEKLFRSQLATFGKDSQASLFICRHKKDVLAAAIIIFYGDVAYYHHSGSVSGNRDIPFSYFLQWEIIKRAKERGCKDYNFWGIAPNDDPKHRFAGVTLFKTGFGGRRIDWLHAHDLPISKFYWMTYVFELARKTLRRL